MSWQADAKCRGLDPAIKLFDVGEDQRRCNICGVVYPLDEGFHRDATKRAGRRYDCKRCATIRVRAYYEENAVELRLKTRLRVYGLSRREFEALRKAADNRCEICGVEADLYIDHNHTTGTVRGMLCVRCNGGLGQFGDSVTRLRAAVAYLAAR